MKCENCKYYEPNPDDKIHGTCHRLPPFTTKVDECKRNQTFSIYWCGEFRDKNNSDDSILNESISGLNFSVRVNNILWGQGIRTVQQLVDLGRKNAKNLRMFGNTSIREVSRKLSDFGIIW